jgi:hypothetical protein
MMTFQGPALRRTAEGFARACALVGCKPAALDAVIAVETGGIGFDASHRPRALFEPHVFYALLNADSAKRAAAVAAGVAYPKWGEKPYPSDSYPHIHAALAIDEERALQATSWGLPQILGRNFAAAGYSSAAVLVEAFLAGEDEHLAAMARFIRAQHLAPALASENWAAFARGYNGAGYSKNDYDGKLRTAFRKISVTPVHAANVVATTTPAALNAQIAVSAARRQGAQTSAAATAVIAAASAPALAHMSRLDLGLAIGGSVLFLAATITLLVRARAQGKRALTFSGSIKGV